MAKTIVTLDRKLINYNNIVSITVELGEYSDDEGEVVDDVYGLIASDTGNNIHVLGVYEDKCKAEKDKNKLKEWLERESHGVYDFIGDD